VTAVSPTNQRGIPLDLSHVLSFLYGKLWIRVAPFAGALAALHGKLRAYVHVYLSVSKGYACECVCACVCVCVCACVRACACDWPINCPLLGQTS
jgi:hypothetical protein